MTLSSRSLQSHSDSVCVYCRTRTASYDGESRSYFSWCEECFPIVSSRPYCYAPACSGRVCGTRTEIVGQTAETTVETARYACPNGCGTATRVGWAIGSGRHAARHDAQAKLDGGELAWLVDVRLSAKGIGGDYDAQHPERRAYARAYVDTAREILGL